MPLAVQDIFDQADEFASRLEDYEPAAEDERDPEVFQALRDAALARSDAERSIRAAVERGRAQSQTPRTPLSNPPSP